MNLVSFRMKLNMKVEKREVHPNSLDQSSICTRLMWASMSNPSQCAGKLLQTIKGNAISCILWNLFIGDAFGAVQLACLQSNSQILLEFSNCSATGNMEASITI